MLRWLDNKILWIVFSVFGAWVLVYGTNLSVEPALRGLSSGISIPIHFSLSTTNQFNRLSTTTALSLIDRSWRLGVGTSTTQYPVGDSSLVVYGTTTIQAPVNTLYTFRILQSASTSLFTVDTLNSRLDMVSAATTSISLDSTGTLGGCIELQDSDGRWTSLYAGAGSATTSLTDQLWVGGRALIIQAGRCQ